MKAEAHFDALLQRMKTMRDADLSVLDASAGTPDSSMTTAPGSANDELWTEMASLGWISIIDDGVDLPGGKRFCMKVYTITAQGVQPIRSLFVALRTS